MSLDHLLTTLQQRSAAFHAQLSAAPATQPCPRHPHTPAVLDHPASHQRGQPHYTCPQCHAAAQAARHQRRQEAAGIPPDVRHATLENFQTDRPTPRLTEGHVPPSTFLEKARLFATGRIRNLVLAGSPGIGKGHLAAALAHLTLAQGQSVRWVDCAALFSAYHRAYGEDSTHTVLHRHRSPHLLILDEICLRDLPADGEEILFAILDHRHKTARRTLLLGNRPAKETRHWLGDRIADRLRSGGISFCYGEWPSLRGTPADHAAQAGEF